MDFRARATVLTAGGITAIFIVLLGWRVVSEYKLRNLAELGTLPSVAAGPTDIISGNASAQKQVVIWGDYQCEECAALHERINEELIPAVGNDFAFIYKDLPFNGDVSVSAAVAARCAGVQGRGGQAQKYLFSHQADLSEGIVNALASEVTGLNAGAWETCRQSSYIPEIIAKEYAISVAYGISRLPAVIIGKEIIDPGDLTANFLKKKLE